MLHSSSCLLICQEGITGSLFSDMFSNSIFAFIILVYFSNRDSSIQISLLSYKKNELKQIIPSGRIKWNKIE